MTEDLSILFSAMLYESRGEALGGVDFKSLPKSGVGGELRAFARRLTGARVDGKEGEQSAFLARGAELILQELRELLREQPELRAQLRELVERERRTGLSWNEETRSRIWRLFFPEGAELEKDPSGAVEELRRRRLVRLTELNPEPLTEPAEELLFTSNVLLTVPESRAVAGGLDLPEELKERIEAVMEEPQIYFYDHPIHMGVELEANEAYYGLQGLNEALSFEKSRGSLAPDARATVILSLSVTHQGLHGVAREYLAAEFAKAAPFEHLEVYLFTEVECRQLLKLLEPYLSGPAAAEAVSAVFGVDGEYGRHYTFLKAIAAFWHVFVDSRVRGTFKIDLDQVFPQRELLEESGESALEHFRTSLWGARGVDGQGKEVELGMIAGALVNEKDIGKGLFTPDVPIPQEIPAGEAAVFYNKLPMALSTRAEMMSRYDGSSEPGLDGAARCLHRVHVTGGTNGILVDSLRRYRPFTPTFVGRAEDQAYLLSVLYDGPPSLRYVHKPGLIMRHDKEAFAGASIAAAEHGRFVGDLARTLLFTQYAEALPWGFERIKSEIDPFTGCFVTRRRYSVVFLRLVLKAATLVAAGEEEEAQRLLEIARRKLTSLLPGDSDSFDLAAAYRREKEAWNLYYDALDRREAEGRAAISEGVTMLLEAARLV